MKFHKGKRGWQGQWGGGAKIMGKESFDIMYYENYDIN